MVGVKIDREYIYKSIDRERKYQDSKWSPEGRPNSDENTPISAWLIYMEQMLNRAKDSIYKLDEWGAMGNIRKLTALGVACMEYNEAPSRELTINKCEL